MVKIIYDWLTSKKKNNGKELMPNECRLKIDELIKGNIEGRMILGDIKEILKENQTWLMKISNGGR